jgi:23S rRNA-/tRNA-specific pseudouridylate synthase
MYVENRGSCHPYSHTRTRIHTLTLAGRPETGRMHQLRVHLQYLGHCIANDPIYNTALWGARKGAALSLLSPHVSLGSVFFLLHKADRM